MSAFGNVFAFNVDAGADAGPVSASADTSAAYGPATSGQPSLGSVLHPATGFGLAFWAELAGVVALIVIYRSLPG